VRDNTLAEVGHLTRVLLKHPRDAFVTDEMIASQWRSLAFTAPPSLARAVDEYAAFVDILRTAGTKIDFLPASGATNLDSLYVRDASIVCSGGVVLCRMGKPLRRNEPEAQKSTYRQLGIPIVGEIQAPGTVEGGDTLWLDERTLAVGRGYRTNTEGIRQLTEILRPLGVQVLVYDLPHWNGAGECLHLMSMISPVAEKVAVVYSRIMAVAFVEWLKEAGWTLIEMPESEFDTMGCNVLALGEGKVVIANRNPETSALLQAAGLAVLEYQGDHISHNRQGGPTCLTRPVYRAS